MALVVTEKCYDCKHEDCLAVCPIDCMFSDEHRTYISLDECIDCLCCALACPRGAIFPPSVLGPDDQKWVDINAQKARSSETRRRVARGLPRPTPKASQGRSAATAYRPPPG